MVAIQAATGAAVAVASHTAAMRFQVHKDPKADAGIKIAIGLALLIASAIVTDKAGWGKQILVGTGVGIGSAGLLTGFAVMG